MSHLKPHVTLHTWQSSHFTPHPSQSTLHTSQFTLHSPQFTLHTPHFTLHSPHFTLLTSHCFLHTPHSTLHTALFTPHTSHCTLHTPHFISSELFSPYPSSSLLISSLLICHLKGLFLLMGATQGNGGYCFCSSPHHMTQSLRVPGLRPPWLNLFWFCEALRCYNPLWRRSQRCCGNTASNKLPRSRHARGRM